MHFAQRLQLKAWTSVVPALCGLVYAVALAGLVSAAGKPKMSTGQTQQYNGTQPKPATQAPEGALPRPVQDMVEAIMTAVRSGRIEDMNDALDWNELKPELGPDPIPDPIGYWKSLSKDGRGQEVLDVLGALLTTKPAVVPYGRDIENNRLYVWPHFAEGSLSGLQGPDADLLAKLAPADAIAAMKAEGRFFGWRLMIGPDGTWHSFRFGK